MRQYVVTGGPGAGISTVVALLRAGGIETQHEVAREIIQEEMSRGGLCLPWQNRDAFQREILQRRLGIERGCAARTGIIVFDRGIPDGIAYYRFDGLDHADLVRDVDDPLARRRCTVSPVGFRPGALERHAVAVVPALASSLAGAP